MKKRFTVQTAAIFSSRQPAKCHSLAKHLRQAMGKNARLPAFGQKAVMLHLEHGGAPAYFFYTAELSELVESSSSRICQMSFLPLVEADFEEAPLSEEL